uniref:relaxase n=1 Tax=Ndongobacter massiliensis TaxID=1871025 RepID=UPI0009F80BF3|nr:relaxase [Ndongobacter massiliensis]
MVLRNLGIQSITQLDTLLTQSADEHQSLQVEIRELEMQMNALSQDIENVHTVHAYRELYKYHKAHPEDNAFAEEYRSELAVYKVNTTTILERHSNLPDSKEILKQLDDLAQKRAP